MIDDRQKTIKTLLRFAILCAVITFSIVVIFMWTIVSDNPRLEYYDASSGRYDIRYIFLRSMVMLIPAVLIAVPITLLIYFVWYILTTRNGKGRYISLALILLALLGLRFLAIADCYPHKDFFDFGKANDGVERRCGLSSDNAWVEK